MFLRVFLPSSARNVAAVQHLNWLFINATADGLEEELLLLVSWARRVCGGDEKCKKKGCRGLWRCGVVSVECVVVVWENLCGFCGGKAENWVCGCDVFRWAESR